MKLEFVNNSEKIVSDRQCSRSPTNIQGFLCFFTGNRPKTPKITAFEHQPTDDH